MAVNNNSNLINQICTVSGLSGKALEDLKTRLAKMSETELQAELSKAIAGNNFTRDMGLVVERTFTQPQAKPVQPQQQEPQTRILKEKQCKEVACQIIDENLREAAEVFQSQNLGGISGAYDNAKAENDKLKTSNVAKVIDYQQAGFIQIIEAKNQNLTKRQYYEENKQRIKDMILSRLNVLKTSSGASYIDSFKGKYSKEKMTEIINAYVERLYSDASIEKLKDIQLQFVSYNQVEEAEALGNFVKNAKDFQENWRDTTTINTLGNEGKPRTLKGPDKGIVPSYWDSDEPISFEEVYKLERGTEYSQYEVEKYVQAKTEMETVINAFNKKQQFIDFTEALRKEELTFSEKEEKLLAGFAEFYALSEDGGLSQLQKIIDKSRLPIAIKDGKLDLAAFPDDASKNRILNQLLKLAGQEKEKDFKAFLGDKTLEEYQLSFEETANDILGEENSKLLADAMVNDNMGMIKRYTGNASMAGMALTVVGGILCFTPAAPLGAVMVTAGNTVAIGGMVAKTGLGVADYATKDVQTQEELEGLAKDFIMDAGGFIIGMKAGQAGMKAFSKLIDQKLVAVFGEQISQGNKLQALKTVFANPEYLKSFSKAAGAKISTDFLISYMGDLAMMGALDTQDDWKSLLQANLTGILVGMSGDIKDVAGVGKGAVKSNIQPNAGLELNLPKDVLTTQNIDTKVQFETRFENFVRNGSVEKMVKLFQEKYPEKNINELYELPVFKYMDPNNRNTQFVFSRIVENFESIKEFPYEKYGQYLGGNSNIMVLSSLKLNEGITFKMLDKYSDYFTKENFASLLTGLNSENIQYLDKYISLGVIDKDNIKNIRNFTKKFDNIYEKYLDKNDKNVLINYIANSTKIDIRHYALIDKFAQFIDKDNIFEILEKNNYSLPSEENINKIPNEIIGSIITKGNFLQVIKGEDITRPIEEYGENFGKVNWNEYREFFGRIQFTPFVVDMMADGIDKNVIEYMCKNWPVASHAGEELPFETYFNNPKLIEKRPNMIKLELYEQCCQEDMIIHAKGNPTVLKMFNELKSKLEQDLLQPVKIVETDKQTTNKFLKTIANTPTNEEKLRNAQADENIKQEIEEDIMEMFPELPSITENADFTKELLKVVNLPEYSALSDNSKFTLKLASILSSVSPNEAYALLGKLNLTHKVKRSVVDLINSDIYLNPKSRFNLPEQHLATVFNTPEKISMLNLFVEAKTGIKIDEQKMQLTLSLQNTINETGIPLFATNLPKGQQLDKIPTVEYDGKKYQVLNLTKIDGDLSAYGFIPGTTIENFSIDATFVRNLGEAETIRLTANPNYAGIPSSSKIGLGQNGTFDERVYGIPLVAVDKNDYILASNKDTDIGHGAKSVLTATGKIYGSAFGELQPYEKIKRNKLAEKVRERLGFTEKQYAELYSQIVDKKYLSQIKNLKIDGQELSSERVEEIKTVLNDVQYSMVNDEQYKGFHNETNLARPEVNQDFILAKVDDISQIDKEWLDYAEKHNLKFILLGSKQTNEERISKAKT